MNDYWGIVVYFHWKILESWTKFKFVSEPVFDIKTDTSTNLKNVHSNNLTQQISKLQPAEYNKFT